MKRCRCPSKAELGKMSEDDLEVLMASLCASAEQAEARGHVAGLRGAARYLKNQGFVGELTGFLEGLRDEWAAAIDALADAPPKRAAVHVDSDGSPVPRPCVPDGDGVTEDKR